MQSPFQLLLDLFDEPKPIPRAAKPAPTVPTEDLESVPGEPIEPLLAPTAFRHPDANREIRLGGVVVAYEFRRARRKNIGFAVGPEGLVVSAPRWVPISEVEQATRGKARWIVGKLEAARERQEKLEAARITWGDGAAFPYLGEQVIVVLDPRHDVGGVLRSDTSTLPGVARQTLHIGLPHTAQPSQIRDAVQAWLMRQARSLFVERLNHYAPQLNVQWRKLTLSSAGTLWGTAHSDGSIRLNWRLVHFRLPVIDYVVAHELSHLRVMDHSPRFWDTVKTVVPNYSELRGQLKAEPLPAW
jgi:predicted metal-dependent hydrolase